MMSTPAMLPIAMPKWGIEMTEGHILTWNVREGDRVAKGDSVLEVETEKIANAVEAPASGVVRGIQVESGQVRPVGSLLAVLVCSEVSDADIDAFVSSFEAQSVSFEPDDALAAQSATAAIEAIEPRRSQESAAGGGTHASPIARRTAQRLGICLDGIKGTGPGGRISKEDVEAQAANLASQAAARLAPGNTRAKMSPTRLTIARRLLESKQSIPHYRLSIDVNVDALAKHRQASIEHAQARPTLNDLLIRASALALMKHPMVNARLEGEEIVQSASADIAFAVATQGGLITPVIRGAERLSSVEIARQANELADKARRGALTREQIAGGSFTVSNLGMFGVRQFDAIINPPQVAILAIGAAVERVVVSNAAPAIAKVMTLTLSADHRVVDGAIGAEFLASLKALIEEPASL